MNWTIIGVILISSVLILAVSIASWASIRAISKQNLQTLASLAQRSEAERIRIQDQWAAERQDFLNRLMTKEWTSYAQLSGISTSQSEETLAPNEFDRGTGEVLIDLD